MVLAAMPVLLALKCAKVVLPTYGKYCQFPGKILNFKRTERQIEKIMEKPEFTERMNNFVYLYSEKVKRYKWNSVKLSWQQ